MSSIAAIVPYEHIQKFTRKYGTVSLTQDGVGVIGEAQVPGLFIYETVWKAGPFGSIPEAMASCEKELAEWMKNKW